MGPGPMVRGHFRASDADREQVIDTLKDAFVQGRLTRDELGERTTRVLMSRTYAELAVVTVDIPALVVQRPPRPEPARASTRKPVNMKTVALASGMIVMPPALWAVFLTYYGGFIVLFLAAFVALAIMPSTRSAGR